MTEEKHSPLEVCAARYIEVVRLWEALVTLLNPDDKEQIKTFARAFYERATNKETSDAQSSSEEDRNDAREVSQGDEGNPSRPKTRSRKSRKKSD